jgi:deoxyribonuclease IV
MMLLENTAGQGSCLGHHFEHLATVLSEVRDSSRLGVCFDTCHAFAAGYPLESADEFNGTFAAFDDLVGLERLKLFHLNDSVRELGSRVDRHAGIGLGKIGLNVFRRLVNDPRFQTLPMILETPKEDMDGNAMDPVNLAILRGFLAKPRQGAIAKKRVKTSFPLADE